MCSADALFLIMREGLTGWDALEGELLQAAGLQVQDSTSAERSATQVAVDALSGLLQDGAFRYSACYTASRLAKHTTTSMYIMHA